MAIGQADSVMLRKISDRAAKAGVRVAVTPSLNSMLSGEQSPTDVRDWIASRTGHTRCERPPLLSRGWRAEVIGSVLEDLLEGRLAIRISNPNLEHPLVFEPTHSSSGQRR